MGLIDGSRNAKLQIVDAALRITPLEVPTSTVDRSQGDIHRVGNPHYWLDPANARPIAETLHLLLEVTRAHAGVAFQPSGEQALGRAA